MHRKPKETASTLKHRANREPLPQAKTVSDVKVLSLVLPLLLPREVLAGRRGRGVAQRESEEI